jgi:hypothetical protein
MILEEIDGDVKVVLNGKTLAVGDSIEDSQWPFVAALGKGKAMFRVDPSCTVEIKAVEAVVEQAAAPVPKTARKTAPVEAAPVIQVVAPTVETSSEAPSEA